MFLAQVATRGDNVEFGFIPIVKVERDQSDPTVRYVWGRATDGTVDSDEQIVDPAFAKSALADWYDTAANVRQMHSVNLPPAGRGVLLEHREGDGEFVRTKVVEPGAVRLVDEGVYTGYSVGISRPRIVRDARARGGRIVGGRIVEISLVDRPANPMAKFVALKRATAGGPLAFVGKAVIIDADPEEEAAARPIAKFGRGDHVTVEVADGVGGSEWVEGRVTARGRETLRLDTAGYGLGGVVTLATTDVVAVYRGSIAKAAGISHTHPHSHGAEPPHEHPHTHAPNHGDHSLAHAHGHPETEESVDDEKQPGEATTDAAGDDDALKAAKCPACGGMFGEDRKCAKCGKAEVVDKATDVAAAEDPDKADKTFPPGAKAPPFGKKPKGKPAPADGPPADSDGDADAGGEPDEDDAAKAARKAAKVAAKAAAKTEKRAAKVARKAEKAARASLPAVPKGEDAVPWLVKRAHDYACGAYPTDVLIEAYPTVEKGGATVAIGEGARAATYAMLAAEVRAAGSPAGVEALGKALGAFDGIAGSEGIAAAREELVAAFKGAQSGEPEGLPKPSETITPGQFRRPYISAGHQAEVATSHDASIPSATHPIHAEDFGRGPLTDGHARTLTQKLADLHDGLADWRPEICCMDSAGSNAFDRQGAGSFARPPFTAKIPNGADGSGPRSVSLPATKAAPGEKSQPGSDVATLAIPTDGIGVKALTREDLEAAVSNAVGPHLNKIAELQRVVDELASAPDTSKSALRGVMTAGARAKIAAPDTAKAERKARRQAKVEKRATYYRDLAASPDPMTRARAQNKLAAMGVEP